MNLDVLNPRTRPAQPRQESSPRRIGVSIAPDDEKLVEDDRAQLRPAQMVENKVSRVLKGRFILVSQLRMRDLIRRGFDS